MTVPGILNNIISKFEWNFKITLFIYENIFKCKLHNISNFVVDKVLVYQNCFFTLLQATIHHENYLININKSVWHNFCKICNSLRISRALFNRKRCDIKRTLTSGKRISENCRKLFLKFSDLSTQSIVGIDDVIYPCMTNHDHHMLISNFSSNSLNLKRPNFLKSKIDNSVSTQIVLYSRIGDSFKSKFIT